MQKRRPGTRPVQLVPSLEKRLNAYAVTAAAAGIGMGLTARSAEAKVVYIPANKVLTSGTFTLPVDRIPSWTFFDGFHSHSLSFDTLSVRPLNGAGVSVANGYARALSAGGSIGPNGVFQSQPVRMERAMWLSDSSMTLAYGPWANVTNRYVGLRFVVNGKAHYGWARFTVANSGSLTQGVSIKATFTGYALETAADRPIPAGKMSGPEESGTSGSLGCLAIGCTGLDTWRPSK
jgi:hypothetical protein